MLIERKVQIEAIKTKSYMAGKADGVVMFTQGDYIVYVPEKDCLINISKIGGLRKEFVEKYNANELEKLLKPIGLTKKMLLYTGTTLRLFENKETGERIWLDQKYAKKFKDCKPYSAYIEECGKAIVFTRYGKIVGLVLPVKLSEDAEK